MAIVCNNFQYKCAPFIAPIFLGFYAVVDVEPSTYHILPVN